MKAWDPFDVAYAKPVYFTDTHALSAVAWSPDAKTLAYGGEKGVAFLRNWHETAVQTLTPERRVPLRGIAFGSEGGSLVTGGSDGVVSLWNLKAAVAPSKLPRLKYS